jgi:hypothetical protein
MNDDYPDLAQVPVDEPPNCYRLSAGHDLDFRRKNESAGGLGIMEPQTQDALAKTATADPGLWRVRIGNGDDDVWGTQRQGSPDFLPADDDKFYVWAHLRPSYRLMPSP